MSGEQKEFLNEMSRSEEDRFLENFDENMNEMELCLTSGDKMIRDDISLEEMYADIMIEEFIAENDREPNYKEMSQGW